ncbi:MAG TPA: NAD(+) synthase [Solirubrobacteraceae bacterium]|jgi:NAD+ synthase (glutamine-hydrolysing)|nr:NAD(+) synthase [Solirubrobacteraceae bacterium]
MRLALCQMNATVGDLAGNAELIRAGQRAARAAGADLVLFPELALTGYPPEDLLLREDFLADARSELERLATDDLAPVSVVGFPERAEDVYNAAAVLAGGAVHAIYRKVYLPNYGVFDEQRYFQNGLTGSVIDIGRHRIGLTVCEDIWEPGPPASEEALAGATLIVNISASPYHAGKGRQRERMFAQRSRDYACFTAFCALVGGQDELLFDGHSFVVDPSGETIARAVQFGEQLLVCDLDLDAAAAARLREAAHRPVARARRGPSVHVLPPLPDPAAGAADKPPLPAGTLAQPLAPEEAEVYCALELGLRDYVSKNGFEHVLLGLSGGIDSALVACLAADALGAQRVTAAVMPSRYSSHDTQADARALARALDVALVELPIDTVLDAYQDELAGELQRSTTPVLAGSRDDMSPRHAAAAPAVGTGGSGHGSGGDLTEENLQARIRGNLLMALSNRFGWLVLTTGNKSEMSVGYSTLYGDLAGGLAVIKDVPKTLVYRLARWRNCAPDGGDGAAAPIPQSVLERAPSAELRPDQRDEDSLPAYDLLDRILQGYIELHESAEQLVAQGLPRAEVTRTIRLVDAAEYKRRQAPPGIKVTERAFGRDRRMPITNRYQP